MTSLQNEYRRRNNLKSVWVVNDGVCFFHKRLQPSIVALMSENCRALTICKDCSSLNTSLVVELYQLNAISATCTVKRVLHRHVRPDSDLCAIVDSFSEGYVPQIVKNDSDAELALWQIFMQTKPLPPVILLNRDKDYVNPADLRNRANIVAQMHTCVINCQSIFRTYYERIYTPFLLGRRYALYR